MLSVQLPEGILIHLEPIVKWLGYKSYELTPSVPPKAPSSTLAISLPSGPPVLRKAPSGGPEGGRNRVIFVADPSIKFQGQAPNFGQLAVDLGYTEAVYLNPNQSSLGQIWGPGLGFPGDLIFFPQDLGDAKALQPLEAILTTAAGTLRFFVFLPFGKNQLPFIPTVLEPGLAQYMDYRSIANRLLQTKSGLAQFRSPQFWAQTLGIPLAYFKASPLPPNERYLELLACTRTTAPSTSCLPPRPDIKARAQDPVIDRWIAKVLKSGGLTYASPRQIDEYITGMDSAIDRLIAHPNLELAVWLYRNRTPVVFASGSVCHLYDPVLDTHEVAELIQSYAKSGHLDLIRPLVEAVAEEERNPGHAPEDSLNLLWVFVGNNPPGDVGGPAQYLDTLDRAGRPRVNTLSDALYEFKDAKLAALYYTRPLFEQIVAVSQGDDPTFLIPEPVDAKGQPFERVDLLYTLTLENPIDDVPDLIHTLLRVENRKINKPLLEQVAQLAQTEGREDLALSIRQGIAENQFIFDYQTVRQLAASPGDPETRVQQIMALWEAAPVTYPAGERTPRGRNDLFNKTTGIYYLTSHPDPEIGISTDPIIAEARRRLVAAGQIAPGDIGTQVAGRQFS